MQSDQVPSEVSGFTAIPPGGLEPEVRSTHNQKILDLEIQDKRQKLWARSGLGAALFFLLLVQNVLVFSFAIAALVAGKINESAAVISIICTATLSETAGVIVIMVRWLFSDMEYVTR